jgi:hypothetical protein
MTTIHERVVQLSQADVALSPSTFLPAALSDRYFISRWHCKTGLRSIDAAAATGVE